MRIPIFYLCYFSTLIQLNATDIDTLKSRLKNEYLKNTSTSTAIALLSSQETNGSWKNINYSSTQRTNWPSLNHVKNIRIMAAAYQLQSHSLYRNPSLLIAIKKGLNFWYGIKPKSNNWWNNDIGKQLSLGPIGILLENEIDSVLISFIINDLNTETGNWTGQNKVWFAQQIIWRGCLESNINRVKQGLSKITEEITVSSFEGIKADHSFQQHGNQLYNGEYGKAFINNTVFWSFMVRGLNELQFTKDKIKTLGDLIIYGTGLMGKGGHIDHQITGRGITRIGATQSKALVGDFMTFASVDTTRAHLYHSIGRYLDGIADSTLLQNKVFYRSDYHIHRKKDFFFSVRMNSERTERSETGNNENLQGFTLTEGATTLLMSGDEYENVYPCWNWSRIPGTTAPNRSKSKPAETWGALGSTQFTGGVTDSSAGVAVFTMDRDSTIAKKGWFMFEKEIVCLGSDINSLSNSFIRTTLEQSKIKTKIYFGNENNLIEEITPTSWTSKNVNWLWFNNAGYFFDTTSSLDIKNQSIIGDWNSINSGKYGKGTFEKKDIATVMIPHGVKPKNQAYNYTIIPSCSLSEINRFIPYHKILRNDKKVQAVQHLAEKKTGIIIYSPDTLIINDTTIFYCDKPGVFLLDHNNSIPKLYLADPSQTLSTLSATLLINDKIILYKSNLPKSEHKGASVIAKENILSYPIVVEVSSEPQFINNAQNVLDKDTISTRWSAEGYPQHLIIDYGKEILLSGLNIWTYENRAYQFKAWGCRTIKNCQEKKDSNLLLDLSLNTSIHRPISQDFPSKKIRYLKVEFTGADNYNGSWVSINEIAAKIDSLSSGIENSNSNALSLYPNPANDFIILTPLPKYSLRLFSQQGQKLASFNLSKRINISSFPSGIYFLQIDNQFKKICIKRN